MTQILRLPKVLERTGLSRSLLYRMLDAGDFPRPIKLGERVNGWRDNEIEDWIAQRGGAH